MLEIITKNHIGKQAILTFETGPFPPPFIITDVDKEYISLSNITGDLHFRARPERVRLIEKEVVK